MKILVTGATGYIGNGVAKTLAMRGHTVYGLYRNDAFVRILKQQEIIPVQGTIEDFESWAKDVLPKVSVVIDTATSSPNAAGNLNLYKLTNTIAEQTKSKKKYIYTSGILTCAETEVIANNIKGEDDLISNLPARFKWRYDLECSFIELCREFTSSSTYYAASVIVRPGFVYGGPGGHYATKWFDQGLQNKLVVYGNREKRWGWVHYEDLGEAFSLIAEASFNVVASQIYHVADESRYSFEDVVVKMGRAAGATCDIEYKEAKEDAFHDFLDVDCLVSSDKIRNQLHWFPRHAPFLENVDLYFQSYVSFKSKNSNH